MTTDLIPQTKEDITKELIQGLLRPKFPRITIDSIEVLKEVHGTGSNIYLKVDHSGADDCLGECGSRRDFRRFISSGCSL
jgi:hypothetical protein